MVSDGHLAQLGLGKKGRFLVHVTEKVHFQVQCDPGTRCRQDSLHLVFILLPSQKASPLMMANGPH